MPGLSWASITARHGKMDCRVDPDNDEAFEYVPLRLMQKVAMST